MNLLNYLCIVSSLLSASDLVSGQTSNHEIPNPSHANPSPPSLLSELGDMFLQVDEAIYKLTNPRERNEDTKQEHTGNRGKFNLRANYFDRVRQNYEDLQKKIQESLKHPANILNPPEIMNLNFQNRGQKSFLDLSLPFLPMNVQLREKDVLKIKEDGMSKPPKVDFPFSDLSGSISIGGDISNKRSIQSNPITKMSTDFQKRSNHYDMGTLNKLDKNGDLSQKQISNWEHDQDIGPERGKQFSSMEPNVEGRVLGDLLYSEDTFDKHFKRVLRDGKWVVDPKVFFPKDIVENVREAAKNRLTDETESKVKLNQNTRTKDNKNKSFSQRHKSSETNLDIILAFTLDGVPLKIKVNPPNGNPLKYLNRILITAGVSLNIPIDSHRSLQPAGKDVLQLGSRSDGGQTYATYVDLTDENQLNSLLETLKKL